MAEILCIAPAIGAGQAYSPAGVTQGVPGFMVGELSFDFSKNESYCSADRLNIVTGGRTLPVSHADVYVSAFGLDHALRRDRPTGSIPTADTETTTLNTSTLR